MKKFFIIVNMDKELAVETKNSIVSFLSSYGNDVSCSVWEGEPQRKYELPEGTDCIITIGGDGTLIQAARATVSTGIPVIGINRGHMGDLTQLTGEEDIEPAILRLINDDFMTDERMMLKASIFQQGKRSYKDVALNEVLLTRHDSIRTMHFSVYVNEVFLNSYSADGLIISTPTGSTAYSLSAGGPIAEPKAKLMIMTPICSHTINGRSLVLSPEDKIKVVVGSQKQLVACDGDSVFYLNDGDEIHVSRSKYVTRLVKLKEESFLETLRDKMNFV